MANRDRAGEPVSTGYPVAISGVTIAYSELMFNTIFGPAGKKAEIFGEAADATGVRASSVFIEAAV